MPQTFRPGANTIARVVLVGLVAFVAGAVGLLLVLDESPYVTGEGVHVDQPIQFSHERHVAGNGIDCRYCHAHVEESSFAGIPPTRTCMNCHSQIFADADYLEPVRASYRNDVPLRWNRVYDLPDFVYFNHSIHVEKGIGCETCHGRVDRMPLILQAVSLRMTWCLDCHRNPELYVRPRERVFEMGYQPPADQPELGRNLVEEYGINRLTDCYTCHR